MTDETRLKKLLRRLDSRYLATRHAAIAESHRLPFESFHRLVELEARWFRRHTIKHRIWGIGRYVILMVGSFLSIRAIVADLNLFVQFCYMFVWFLGFGVHTLFAFTEWQTGADATRARLSLREAIHKLPKGERLPFLLILMQTPSVTVYGDLRRMLKAELMHLRASDTERLTLPQKKSLAAMLAHPYEDVDLTLNVLKALEQVGGEEAVPAVQKLADRAAKTKKHAIIHDAARECLPYLRNHAQERRNSQVLLRPTIPVAPPTSQLLRPISTRNGETRGKHLLRPVTLADDAPMMTSSLHTAKLDEEATIRNVQANENVEGPNSYSQSGALEAPLNVLLAGIRK